MRAAATLAGLFVLALSSRAMAEVDCANATSFTPKEVGECIKKWEDSTPFPEFPDDAKTFQAYSAKDISSFLPDLEHLAETLATSARRHESAAETAQTEADKAKAAAETAQTDADKAKTDADKAKTEADKAKTAAKAAQTKADKAKTDADKAKAAAEAAQTKVDKAKTDVDRAKTAAEAAQTKANKAKTDADKAEAAAEVAQAQADKAKTDADKAEAAAEVAQAQADGAKTDADKANAALTEAKDESLAAQGKSNISISLRDDAQGQLAATEQLFRERQCEDLLIYCIDRNGVPYSSREEIPSLLPGDALTVVVLSSTPADDKDVTLTAHNVRRSLVLIAPARGTDAASVAPAEVTRLEVTVAADALRVEVTLSRASDGYQKKLIFPIDGRQHLVEFGLMLPFAYQREVTPQGAVKYGMEPDLAFTITVFLAPRLTSEPLQKFGRRWFGLMAGADLTNQVSDKRYYLGLDFSPVSGLALNAGLAILPWEYIPNPEQVPDVLTSTIEPDQRYRASFFFGARMTPEVFDTVKAAYEALRK